MMIGRQVESGEKQMVHSVVMKIRFINLVAILEFSGTRNGYD